MVWEALKSIYLFETSLNNSEIEGVERKKKMKTAILSLCISYSI